MLGACSSLGDEACQIFADTVIKYGIEELAVEFVRLLSSLSLRATVILLELVKGHCPLSSTSSVSWSALLQMLVNKILQSPLSGPYSRWSHFCPFVIANCDNDALVCIAKYLGEKLHLSTLNQCIAKMMSSDNFSTAHDVFVRQLQMCAVSSCVAKDLDSIEVVIDVVDGVVKGARADLMAILKPRLLKLSTLTAKGSELFRKLFATPSVVKELKRDSPVSDCLESLLQARISKITPLSSPPVFSWCMPGVKNASGNPAVSEFLAGPEESTVVSGFKGIVDARTFASSFRSPYFDAVAQGSGAKASVLLTKNRNQHDNAMQKRNTYMEELNSLQELVRARGPISSVQSAGPDLAGTVGAAPQEQHEAPPLKPKKPKSKTAVSDSDSATAPKPRKPRVVKEKKDGSSTKRSKQSITAVSESKAAEEEIIVID